MCLEKDFHIVGGLKISQISPNSTFHMKDTCLGYFATNGNAHYLK